MAKSKLTPKENYLRLTTGEIPEHVPLFTMSFPSFNGEIPCKIMGPSLFDETHITPAPTGRIDVWGVNYIANQATNFACIPEPNNYILEDITKWHDVIKKPEMPNDIDWEKMAKIDCERVGLNRTQEAAMGVIGLMPFQQLIAFMGFENGLMAFYEEPDCVKDLLNFMTDIYVPIIQATVDHYNPDIMYLLDDTATNNNPFMSPAMFREFLKPVYKRLTQPIVDRGIPIQFHNCGRCEDFLDDMMDIGTKIWDPAQVSNNLMGIKSKYGRRLAIAGGFNWVPPSTWPNVTEDHVKQLVRDCIDKYAPDGGFAFFGAALGQYGDKTIEQVNKWISEESFLYGRDYYLK